MVVIFFRQVFYLEQLFRVIGPSKHVLPLLRSYDGSMVIIYYKKIVVK